MRPVLFGLVVAVLLVSCSSLGAPSMRTGTGSCSSGHVGKPGEAKPPTSCRP